MTKFNPQVLLWGGLALIVAIGGFLRFYMLGFPEAKVFDEVYFPVFAAQFLEGIKAFDVHPPLGKLVIAVSIAIFGDTPVGWRLVPALFGLATIPLAGYLWWKYAQDKVGALVIALLIALDTMLITYSRVGLMDGVMAFWILAVFLMAVVAKRPAHVFVLATILGLAVAVKWIALGVLLPVGYVLWRKGLLVDFIFSLWWALLVYLGVCYAAEIMGGSANPWQDLSTWHSQAFAYHANLKDTHPWGSVWWTWPLMLRPVLMYYQANAEGNFHVISAIGNPLVWWPSTAAVLVSAGYLASLVAKKIPVLDHPLVPLLLGWLAFFIPWVRIERVVFLCHYIPAYVFALLMLVYWLRQMPRRIMGATLFAMLVSALFFMPMATAWPLALDGVEKRLWLKTWL